MNGDRSEVVPVFNPYQPPESLDPTELSANQRANRSLILGAVAVTSWFLPPLCLVLALAGMILGILGWRSERRVNAGLGIGFSGVALVMTAVACWVASSFSWFDR